MEWGSTEQGGLQRQTAPMTGELTGAGSFTDNEGAPPQLSLRARMSTWKLQMGLFEIAVTR